MNDTWKQTDPTIKKRKPTWKNTTVTYLLCNCAASPHHSATMQHHNAKLTILVKLKSQTICEKLNLTIDDPIMCLQENQFFSIFDFQIKFEISELFRHWGFKSQMLFIKSLPTKFVRFRIPLSIEIYHRWNFSDLHVFFLFFFCFQIAKIKWFLLFLLCLFL